MGRFHDRTDTRLDRGSALSPTDADEKDIGVGDLDLDGDEDLVICSKFPRDAFIEGASRHAVLLLNESGTLRNRTETRTDWLAADKAMDCREVLIAELTGDRYPDVVFANTSDQMPRFYRNLGILGGRWMGLVDETALRFPDFSPTWAGMPRQRLFCDVAAGDVDGDGRRDLFFGAYRYIATGNDDNKLTGDVLLMSRGVAFRDETIERLGERRSTHFTSDVDVRDFDGDGDDDIIKNTTKLTIGLFSPKGTHILRNDGAGRFTTLPMLRLASNVDALNTYMFALGRIDDDAHLDAYMVDDGIDIVTFGAGFTGQIQGGATDALLGTEGGNVHLADVDGDGDLDAGIANADTEIDNCDSSTFEILTNVGRRAAAEDFGGQLLQPAHRLRGREAWAVPAWDFAFIDIDGDGRKDVFLALCTGYRVLMWEGRGQLNPDIPIGRRARP